MPARLCFVMNGVGKSCAAASSASDPPATARVAARRAQPAWAAMTGGARGRILRRAADILRARNRELSARVTELENALQAQQRAQAVNQARAALAGAREQLENTRIRAPFSGTVEQRFVELGEQIMPGTPVLRVVDPGVFGTRAVIKRLARSEETVEVIVEGVERVRVEDAGTAVVYRVTVRVPTIDAVVAGESAEGLLDPFAGGGGGGGNGRGRGRRLR